MFISVFFYLFNKGYDLPSRERDSISRKSEVIQLCCGQSMGVKNC